MTSPVTLDPNVHTRVPSSIKTDDNQLLTQIRQLAAQVPQIILSEVVAVIKQETGIDLSGAETLLEDLGKSLGFNLNDLPSYFQGIDLTQPGSILSAIESAIQNVVTGIIQKILDAITGGLNKSQPQGSTIQDIISGFLNPGNVVSEIEGALSNVGGDLQALIAGLEGRLTAVETNVGTIASATSTTATSGGTDNFNRAAIGPNWVNITGTLAIQNFGDGYVRTAALAAGYYGAGNPATDKHGVTVRLTAKAAGLTRVAVCSDTAMANYAALEIYAGQYGDDYLRVVTGSSPSAVVGHTQFNFSNYGLQDNTVVSLKYEPSANMFHVFKDGAELTDLQWVDSGNIVTHGPGKKLCPIVSNASNDPYAYGFGITDYTYFDWT